MTFWLLERSFWVPKDPSRLGWANTYFFIYAGKELNWAGQQLEPTAKSVEHSSDDENSNSTASSKHSDCELSDEEQTTKHNRTADRGGVVVSEKGERRSTDRLKVDVRALREMRLEDDEEPMHEMRAMRRAKHRHTFT